ncbi:MAG: hypothetical protein Kow0025_08390 [Thermodesulfovibrionales bacterium]
MRKAIATFTVALFVLSLAALALASGMEMTGEVMAVDKAAKTITMKSGTKEMTVHYDDMTKMEGMMSMDELKAGDKVKVEYMEKDGKMMAREIYGGEAMKMMKEEKKKY